MAGEGISTRLQKEVSNMQQEISEFQEKFVYLEVKMESRLKELRTELRGDFQSLFIQYLGPPPTGLPVTAAGDKDKGVLGAPLGFLPKDSDPPQAQTDPSIAAGGSVHLREQPIALGASGKGNRLECPRFDGTDFRGWWTKLEQYLEAVGTPAVSKFGMAGALFIKGVAVTKYKRSAVKDNDEWPFKYSKFFVELDDDPTSVPTISELGPNGLFEPMTINEFTDSLSKKKIGIKALLLDQCYISGIGNWIADEVLYQARIHPLQICSSLSKENCATLHNCIKEVIEKAVEVGADSGQFISNWIFHFREKKLGKVFVDGKKIDFINKLNGKVATKAAGKPRKQASKKKGGDEAEDNDDDEDGVGDEPTNEEEESTKITKPKKGGNPRSRGKKLL
ncbi:hypothetical protein ES332_D10G086600v1 [Gossypium tomentosum]|uniref:Formamidopyrimidine-DNA glycosylase H2TH DNA-binding domain-containing protein n=1 Tax=Gossypium tomentosum TaxID=34277 RepID=A0A5D2J1J1_GOSTO|nr:hypothetical protein ES332_D10G086600v1 [Gossypium tomentosum]